MQENQTMARFRYFQGQNGQWYWRLVDGNNQVVAIGGEGYTTEYSVQRAIANVIATVPQAARVPVTQL